MTDVQCIQASVFLILVEGSILAWMFTDFSLLDIGLFWLTVGLTCFTGHAIWYDLKTQNERPNKRPGSRKQ